MEYFVTKNGTIVDENMNIVPMDESTSEFKQYYNYLKNEGEVKPTDFETEIEKQIKIDELKKQCYNELSLSDWYYIRSLRGIPVPKEIEKERQAILDKYDELILQLSNGK